MCTYKLVLCIAGQTPRSRQAVENLKAILDECLAGQVDLTVVDVKENPQYAEDNRIFATPTLLKFSPPPTRRMIGDMSDREGVLAGLSIAATSL